MDVRAATLDDADAISALNVEVQRVHSEALPGMFKPPTSEVFSAGDVRELLADSTTFMFIALCGGEPAGYIYAQIMRRTEDPQRYAWERLHVHHISVNQAFQRQGAGQALMEAVIALAKGKGLTTITAGYWSFNLKSRSFFAAQGFTAFNENVWLHLDLSRR